MKIRTLFEQRRWRALPLLIASALLATAPALARESDRRQPATITANRAEIDRAAGQSRYYGDVVFVQGTLRITAQRLFVTVRNGMLRHAIAHGEPARIRTRTDKGRLVRAHAQTIEYKAAKGVLVLTGEAVVRRDGDRFAADWIRYWLDSGRLIGRSGEEGDSDRVRIRLVPDSGENTRSGDNGTP